MHCKLVTCRATCVYSNPFTDAAILCPIYGQIGCTCSVVKDAWHARCPAHQAFCCFSDPWLNDHT